jgi:hypothetical protein
LLTFRYNKLVGGVKKIATKLAQLDPKDPFKREMTDGLLNKLFAVDLFCGLTLIDMTWGLSAARAALLFLTSLLLHLSVVVGLPLSSSV